MQFYIAAFIFATFIAFIFCEDDEIKGLPGLNFDINFKHYSGYLQVSETHFLHYWFVESQNDPSTDPLIFWYNGGPGCSSVEGILHEMGPYQVNPDGKTLKENPNSWNKFSSVVYIEAPAGVGYSYSTDGNITASDDTTAYENYEGLKQFFKKYPSFRNHSTFIMGESYGGIYIPTLTTKIIENQKDFPINLGGMAIGNGALYGAVDIETKYKFLYSHGLIDELTWETFEGTCCNGCVDTCDFTNLSSTCVEILTVSVPVNLYDIYGKCETRTKFDMKEAIFSRNLMMTSRFLQKSSIQQSIIPCLDDTDIRTYMNQPEVRTALNIPENLQKWQICSRKMFVTYKKQYTDMTSFFKKVIAAKIPILIYFGDTDLMCNFLMGQKFALQLGLPLIEAGKAWMVNGQMAGMKTVYDGLTFTTIRGAGHMAPQFRAPETAHAIKQFLSNEPI